MTLWSLGWLEKNLTRRGWLDRATGWTVSVSLVLEVAFITLQRWRGTASHFNHATTVDEIIDFSMLGLIVIAFLGICYFTVRCFGKLKLDADFKLALRAGVVFLVASCLIGFMISVYGYERLAEGLSPEKVGKSGVPKFPHGIAIHALQMLPLAVFVMRRLATPLTHRASVVRWLTASFVLQIVFASYQTFNGYARGDLQTPLGILLACAVCSLSCRSCGHRCETLAICGINLVDDLSNSPTCCRISPLATSSTVRDGRHCSGPLWIEIQNKATRKTESSAQHSTPPSPQPDAKNCGWRR